MEEGVLIKTCDSGSLPFLGDVSKFLVGAELYGIGQKTEASDYFEEKVVRSFLDKIRAGIDVPNYSQFRDMNEMFLSIMDGIEKTKTGYLETNIPFLNISKSKFPEIFAIESNSKMIHEETKKTFEMKVCITGPYTLASFFSYRDEGIFTRLGNVISKINDLTSKGFHLEGV